jgi:N-acetylmuramoyl-L-alanine amidase
MRNSDSRRRAAAATVVLWLAVCADAQAQTARARYEATLEREETVRALLTGETKPTPGAQLAAQVAQVLTSFESLVRRFPTSGYADNALFQAGSLADSTYEKFRRPEDRDRAVRLFRWLVREYPASSLVKRANAKLSSLTSAAMAVTPPPVAPPAHTRPAAAAPVVATADPALRATLSRIDRQPMRDAVRVIVELDREVNYFEQQLSGPARVFFDLQNVQAVPELRDTVLTYPGDVVSKVRIGRHPNSIVRVVLDLEDVEKYSVFTLYDPFRIVIDAERTAARNAAMTPPPLAATPFSVASMSGAVAQAAFVLPERPEIPAPPPDPLPATVARAWPLPAPVTASRPPMTSYSRTSPPSSPPAPPDPAPVPPPVPAVPAAPSANAAGGFSIARQLGLSVSRIVIDPGHGGHDPGVLGKGLTEATLVLDVSLRLEKLLQKDAGVEVVLTRRTDVYVPLEERTEIANRHSADMFLSIHANASRNQEARGIETFFLSFASSADAEAVAARENSASTREMHQLPDLIKTITLNSKLDESRDLAGIVQDSLVSNLRKSNRDVRSRGVKKAPFVVLIGAAMPSVLAEISFVSNAKELALLKTAAYRQKIAEALYAAVTKYRRSLKNQTLTELPDR